MKFMSAYFHRNFLLQMAHDVFSPGPRPKMRPEATIFGYSQLLNGWTVMNRLGEIKVPTMVMAGRYDFLFPPEHQAILADRLPNAELVLIERAGHNPQMERTTEVIEIIKSFMAEVNPVSA
jgi:proline iminopeptidase